MAAKREHTMRSLLTGFVLAILSLVTANAQTKQTVSDIRADVTKINSFAARGRYTKTKKDVPGISTEGAEAMLFHSGKDLKKVVAKIYGETFKGVSEFYFKGGELIFEYDRINRYDTQIGLSRPVKVVRVEHYRSYFDNGKMIRLLIGNKTIKPGSDEFVENEKRSAETVKSILEPESGV
jgi:hypothetical protein